MSAVVYRLRSSLRARWLSIVVLTVIVAAVTSIVITFAAGARRTSTIPDRYTESVGGAFGAEVMQQGGGSPRTAEIAALPGVAGAESWAFAFGGLVTSDGDEIADGAVLIGTEGALGARVVDGRSADPDVPTEFVAGRAFMELTGSRIGDRFELVTYTPEQAQNSEFGVTPPAGPTFDATLVGVIDGPSAVEDPTPMALFSPSLIDAGGFGLAITSTVVRFEPGTDFDDFNATVAALPDSTALSVDPGDLFGEELRRAITTQARGIWMLAAVAALAAIAVLGQLISRQMRLSAHERQQLGALGFTESQVLQESVARASVPILFGCVLGAGVAVGFSGRFPVGFARQLEPDPGILVDPAVLAAVTGVLLASLLLWTLGSLTMARWSVRSVRPSEAVEAIATRTSSPTAGLGIRFAFTRARGERGSVRAALVGVMLTVAGLVAALTFGSSLGRLIDEPFRYGSNYDVAIGDNGGEQIASGLVSELERDPEVTSLAYEAAGFARSGESTVSIVGIRIVRGDSAPPVVEGRLPTADDEIALGRSTAAELNVGPGDSLPLEGPSGTGKYRVSGLVVMPSLGSLDGVGTGALMTTSALSRLDDSAAVVLATVKFTPGSDRLAYYGAKYFNVTSDPDLPPATIGNLERVRAVPFMLAGLLGLLAVLTVAHGMLTSLRARRHDLAVVRSLGGDRRFISRAVHWQATAFTVVPAVLAVPIGLIVGRLVFSGFARDLGAVDSVSMPLAIVAAVIAGVVLLANAVAMVPAARARQASPAALLKAE